MKRKGICSVCGCTDNEGCGEGCTWFDLNHSLCSVCWQLSAAQRLRKRDAALADLERRLDRIHTEKVLLELRLSVLTPEPGKRKPQRTTPAQHPRFPNRKEARK